MGIFSTIGNLIIQAGNNASKLHQEIKVYTEDYRNESDEFLKKKLKNGYGAQKYAAANVLKERGYVSQNLSE